VEEAAEKPAGSCAEKAEKETAKLFASMKGDGEGTPHTVLWRTDKTGLP